MKKTNYIKFGLAVFMAMFFYTTLNAQQLMGDLFPSTGGKNQKSGPTEITSNSMDFNLKDNTITLFGSVVVNNEAAKINADKIIVFLTDTPSSTDQKGKTSEDNTSTLKGKTKKEAKTLIAIGNVIIVKKPSPKQEGAKKTQKATAGRADYNLKTGIIVLTGKPVLYQGDSYIKGNKITLFKNSDRVKVEGNQSMGQQSSKLIFNPDNEEKTDK